jgi:hypothetical protein
VKRLHSGLPIRYHREYDVEVKVVTTSSGKDPDEEIKADKELAGTGFEKSKSLIDLSWI